MTKHLPTRNKFQDEEKEQDEEKLTTIPIEIVKKVSFLDNLVLLEYTDPNLVTAITENKEFELDFKGKYCQYSASQLYKNVSNQLQEYNNLYNKKIGAYKVLYKKTEKHKWGRVFPKKALGFTSFSRKIRNTLMKDFYVDFDIKNAQVEIMNNICSSNNIELTAIKEYCNNRDQILKDVMNKYTVDRKTAKNLFLSLSFFGNFDGWTFKNKIKNRKPTDFINNYVNDIHKFYEIVKEKNETLYNTARKKSP